MTCIHIERNHFFRPHTIPAPSLLLWVLVETGNLDAYPAVKAAASDYVCEEDGRNPHVSVVNMPQEGDPQDTTYTRESVRGGEWYATGAVLGRCSAVTQLLEDRIKVSRVITLRVNDDVIHTLLVDSYYPFSAPKRNPHPHPIIC